MERYKEYKNSGVQWIGDIPSHWKTPNIGRIFDIKAGGDVKPEYYSFIKDEEHPYPVYTNTKDPLSVYAYTSKPIFKEHTITVTGRGEIGRAIFRKTPYDAIIRLLSLSPKLLLNCEFFTYFIDVVIPFTSDSAAIGQLSAVQIKPKIVVFPPLTEQNKIVSYLNFKTSKIDEYIVEKEKEVQLLNELKEAEIAKVVTQGLNPNVKIKDYDSLISSSCPENWSIVRNKSFLSLTGEKVGSRANEFLLLSLTTKGVIVRDVESGKGKFPKDFDTYQYVRKGELVFCLFDIDETPRTVGLVETEGMLTGAYTALKVNPKLALPEYIYNYYLCVDNIKALKPYYSGLRKTIRADKFLQIYMPLPPLDEQRAIIAYINEKTEKVDSLITDLQAEIEHLKEYKQRLIADCVTGQVNVQNE